MKSKISSQTVLANLARTTDDLVSRAELTTLLESNRRLRMKFGADLTAPFLHLGHAVNLWMYRALQDLGHKLVFLCGDATTKIGDPTGRLTGRPLLSLEEMKANEEEFIRQIGIVVHTDPEVFEVRRNSEWFGTMSATGFLQIVSLVTHDKLLARDMFRQRIEEGKSLYTHELLYPILQGYDSVMLESDLTIIGSDQLYNEMMGRFFQEKFGQSPQCIITSKITPGIDGKAKQSKSLGNFIALTHTPREKFGRTMSIPDNLITQYFEVYTTIPAPEVELISSNVLSSPMECKLKLAHAIVSRYHGETVADQELEWFKETFSRGSAPRDMPEVVVASAALPLLEVLRQVYADAPRSNSELRRLVAQGGVSINREKVRDLNSTIMIPPDGVVIKIGKLHWVRVRVGTEGE